MFAPDYVGDRTDTVTYEYYCMGHMCIIAWDVYISLHETCVYRCMGRVYIVVWDVYISLYGTYRYMGLIVVWDVFISLHGTCGNTRGESSASENVAGQQREIKDIVLTKSNSAHVKDMNISPRA